MKKNTTLSLSTIQFLPGAGRGITESIDFEESGELHRDAVGEGFVITIPGADKMTITYTCSGDWAAPAIMHVPLLSELDVILIDPWQVPFEAGQTSVTLPRAAWSDEDMTVFLDDKTTIATSQWTWASPRVVTLFGQSKAGFVEFRPKIRGVSHPETQR